QMKGIGPSTAAQTAWALMGLMSSGDCGSETISRGIEYLLRTQLQDGSWHDLNWTGTGFPKVFYLNYHLYAAYFPLQALVTYHKMLARGVPRAEGSPVREPARTASE